MGSNTADEYIQQFETLADELELDEVALIHIFEHGLHCSVTEKIYGLEVMPKTLKSWKEYASRFDNQFCQFHALTKDFPNSCYSPQMVTNPTSNTMAPACTNVAAATPTTTQTHFPPTVGPVPMDIDWAHARCQEEFMKKGLCFRCGQNGHVAKDCPQARPVIRTVDIEMSEGTASASEGGRTPATDVEAVVKAVLAKTKNASADIKKKDF
jgi:hypothetical protein